MAVLWKRLAWADDITATKIDDLAAPDDNTDLNVSTSRHGLCPKLPNNTTTFLRGDGSYAAPSAAESLKAWVNFDGTTNSGGNCTIRASANVSSVTDNGTGDYTINFTNALSDGNYAVATSVVSYSTTNVQCVANIAGTYNGGAATKTASALRIVTGLASTGANFDFADISVSIFR